MPQARSEENKADSDDGRLDDEHHRDSERSTRIATRADVLARTVKPSPARQSLDDATEEAIVDQPMIEALRRLREEERPRGETVRGWDEGTTTPTNAIPMKKNPRTRKSDRSTRLLTMGIEWEVYRRRAPTARRIIGTLAQ